MPRAKSTIGGASFSTRSSHAAGQRQLDQHGDRTFMEENPDLATAFAVLALSYTDAGKR